MDGTLCHRAADFYNGLRSVAKEQVFSHWRRARTLPGSAWRAARAQLHVRLAQRKTISRKHVSMGPGYEHMWGSALTAALVLFIIYRRFRRSFGRQPLRPKTMAVRMAILTTLGVLLAPAAVRSMQGELALGAGLAVGLGLGVWAAKHTRFERHQDHLHYIPHTYTGMVVAALFLGRLIYRFVVPHEGYTPMDSVTVNSGAAFGSIYQNPLTLGIFFLLIGYYLYYYGYVLWEAQHLKPDDLESPDAAD
jgi:hypothetical protein